MKKTKKTKARRKHFTPAIKAKADWKAGVCKMRGCSGKTGAGRRKWCATHRKEVRTAQLAANGKAWLKAA